MHASTLPLVLGAACCLASTDLPTRAALRISAPQLNALVSTTPTEGHETDEWAGLFHVTWTSTDPTGTTLTVNPIPGLNDIFSDTCSLIHATPDELRHLTRTSPDWTPPPLNHLSANWYSSCSPTSD
ncbi:hypothetical protein GCM10027589_21220 [Actinocorallia lasiicapitis]